MNVSPPLPPTTTPKPVVKTVEPTTPTQPAQPAQNEPAKASRGNKIAGGIAFGSVAQFFVWVICDRENIEWCKAPDFMRGPLDDRFDQQRYGTN